MGRVYVVTVRRGGELVGLAPFSRTRLSARPVAFDLLVTAGAEHGYYGEPLLGSDPRPVADAVAQALGALVARGTTTVNLRRLWTGGPLHQAVERQPGVVCEPMGPPADSAVARFDQMEDPDAYLRRLAKKFTIGRRSRRLAERFDHVEYLPEDPDIDRALDAMSDMLGRRWDAGTGPKTFTQVRRAAFTRAALHELAAAGQGGISSLKVDGRHVAVSAVLRVGSRIYSDYSAIEPELMSLGVGNRELYELLCHSQAIGLTEVDLGAVADYPYKLKWTNTTHSSQSVALTPCGHRHKLTVAARRAAMSYRARRLTRLERRPWAGG